MKYFFLLLALFCLSCSTNRFSYSENGNAIKDSCGIIARSVTDSLVEYVDKRGKEYSLIPNLVKFDRGTDGLIQELFSSVENYNDTYSGRVSFFILFNSKLQIQEIRTFEPAREIYKVDDMIIEKYVEYLKGTEGRWIKEKKNQKRYLFIFSAMLELK